MQVRSVSIVVEDVDVRIVGDEEQTQHNCCAEEVEVEQNVTEGCCENPGKKRLFTDDADVAVVTKEIARVKQNASAKQKYIFEKEF